MRKQWLVLLVAVMASAALWGCGSSSSSGGSDEVTTIADVDAVGIVNCVKCHSPATPETDSWLTSAHANPNGSPRHLNPHEEGSSCQPCHNQLLDGDKLDEAFTDILIGMTSGGTDVYASDERDVVSCESCHGPGSAHRGIGPIAYPRPDWEQCVQCHDHPEGVRHADDHGLLASSIGASAHNNSDGLHASTTRCQRCHSVEGSVALAQYTGDAEVMHLMDDLDPIAAEEDLHAVTCAACHIPHDDSGRWENFIVNDNDLASGDWDPNGNGIADQFDFCTSCHTYYNQDGTLTGSGSAASGTAAFYHNTAWYRQITSTHYDDPTTGYGLAESLVEGYVIRQTIDGADNPNPCFDCHGHELRTNTRHSRDIAEADDNPNDYGFTIHTQWASSGHAGGLLNAKYAADPDGTRSEEVVDAVMAAGASDDTSNGGFTHYNWDDTDGRGDCQMCHTATGFVNYVADPLAYDPLNNDFSHLDSWNAVGGSNQNELLYCWGCHDNPQTGTLRTEDPVVATYTYGGLDIEFPDSGSSNTCIVCHSGRGNNETVSDSSRFAGHHAPAAATLFNELTHVGGEYVGLDYTNVSYFAHDSIDVDGTGPCVACHMDDANHEFAVVEKDDEGAITEIVASVCTDCHNGEHVLTAEELEHESESYQEAGQLLLDIINQTNGLTNYTTAVISQGNADDDDRRAFQNSKLTTDEKGGFAHNRYYVKRLIFDAIDWAEDGAIDGTIGDYTAVGTDYQYADGMAWLGTERP